jgi:hypothetical protein
MQNWPPLPTMELEQASLMLKCEGSMFQLPYMRLVWTPCLMHRCVYLTIHITNLQLQTTFSKPLYVSHSACIHRYPGRWKSWCLHCLWPVRYQHTADHRKRPETANICWVCCWYWYQNLGGAPPGAGHAFPRERHIHRVGGGGSYLFLPGFSSPCMMPSMDGWRDGWMEKTSWKTTTTSFTICYTR